MFVVIEGADASGKATQSRMLADKMEAKRYQFPDYETPMGKLIEGHLKRYWEAVPTSDTAGVVDAVGDVNLLNAFIFQALQLTNRMEHAVELAERIEDDEHIVADRYWHSGYVYGAADGLDPEWLESIHKYLPQPDLHLLLDISPGQSVERRPERRDRYEEQEGLMDKVVHLYRKLWRERAENGGDNWVVINGRDNIESVHWQIVKEVEEQDDVTVYPHVRLPWRVQ